MEHIFKNFKGSESTLLELSLTEKNLQIHENISKKVINVNQLNIFNNLFYIESKTERCPMFSL